MERQTISDKFPIGSKMPSFELSATDNKRYGSNYLKGGQLALVVFTCNHCPYVKGSEEVLIETVKNHIEAGLRTVAINSNDPVQYPEDNFESMVRKSREKQLPYPYLVDEDQKVAKLFDAQCTPECYLFDQNQTLIFHGSIIENPRDPQLKAANYLDRAIGEARAARRPIPEFVNPIGCSIKWTRASL